METKEKKKDRGRRSRVIPPICSPPPTKVNLMLGTLALALANGALCSANTIDTRSSSGSPVVLMNDEERQVGCRECAGRHQTLLSITCTRHQCDRSYSEPSNHFVLSTAHLPLTYVPSITVRQTRNHLATNVHYIASKTITLPDGPAKV